MPQEVKIEESWKQLLTEEFEQPYFSDIKNFLLKEKDQGIKVYPPGPLIFNAFNLTPVKKVKAVILGQDPYHGAGQAHGLSFSVPDGVPPPPSLLNIFKELHADLGIPISRTGNLTKWAEQGVLLLNSLLTVRANDAASHHGIGWETFTGAVISKISQQRSGVVFLLWGRFAQEKQPLIDLSKNYVLKSAHPSPFSANNGFFGCHHFSKTNDLLAKRNADPIDWKIE